MTKLSDERREQLNLTIAGFMDTRPQHDFAQFGDKCYWCKCHFTPANAASRCKWAGRDLPDYTSESEPRNRLSEVEAKVIEKFGAGAYGHELVYQSGALSITFAGIGVCATATAEQRCLAIEAVIKGGGENGQAK